MSNLTPAPWIANTNVSDSQTEADFKFFVLARHAFDVMLRRKWNPEFYSDGWGVDSAERYLTLQLMRLRWPDPFTAIVEADMWYRKNIEAKV